MARKLELAADVVRALQELAARLLPYDDRSIAPAHREGWIRLAVAELSYFNLGGVARRAGVRTPSVKGLVAALEAGGFRAASTHVEGKAVKTDAPMAACVDAARVADAAGS